MTDWGRLYLDHVDALTSLAGSLDDDQVHQTVPATPAWTVRDVYAHLTGVAADGVSGRTDGAPGPEWTARHVGERAGVPLPDLVAELRGLADAVAASVADSASPGTVWDMAVHHADLHEGLGRGAVPTRFWAPVLAAVGPRVLAGLPVEVTADGEMCGAGGHPVEVAPYELFRAVFSRRSRAQVRSWGSPALTDEQLAELAIFGPRDDDQPVPAAAG